MLNFALSLIPKVDKNASSLYPALKVLILIRKDSLASNEFNAKAICKSLKCRMSFLMESFKTWGAVVGV